MNIVLTSRDVSGAEAASLLLSDYAAATADVSITIDSAEAWAGVVWRIGRGALKLFAGGGTAFTATEALQIGLIDDIATDADEWHRRFLENRSALALDSAAMLLRNRGGDALERAEFARLFAAGEPQ